MHDSYSEKVGAAAVEDQCVSLGDVTLLTLGGDRRGSEDKRYVYSTIELPGTSATVTVQ